MPCCSRKNDEGEQDELQKSSTRSAGRAAAESAGICGRGIYIYSQGFGQQKGLGRDHRNPSGAA